ncbi:MAG: class I SAM-dependent methyltransferase [Patescibacteria group bacterium]|nr:class I SAM-dependent methyltransferase [Patescibacteria group bacterium]
MGEEALKLACKTLQQINHQNKIEQQLDHWQFSITPGGRTFRYVFNKTKDALVCKPLPTKKELQQVYEIYFDYEWYYKVRYFKQIQGWHRWQILKKQLQPNPTPKVIYDIGCGHGWFLKNFIKWNSNLVGVDYPGTALEHAKKNGHKYGFHRYLSFSW